jgi:hypothetical protein
MKIFRTAPGATFEDVHSSVTLFYPSLTTRTVQTTHNICHVEGARPPKEICQKMSSNAIARFTYKAMYYTLVADGNEGKSIPVHALSITVADRETGDILASAGEAEIWSRQSLVASGFSTWMMWRGSELGTDRCGSLLDQEQLF